MKPVFRTVLLLFLLFLGAIGPSFAQEEHQAALVVDFGDGRVLVRVVSFAEDTISGVDLLRRSGLEVAMVSGGVGTAICAIEGVGCPPTPQECFCACQGGTCRYWAYFHLRDGEWVYAGRGAADRRLGDGDVDGWVWGDGKSPPPLRTWEEIRAASRALPPIGPSVPGTLPPAPAFSPGRASPVPATPLPSPAPSLSRPSPTVPAEAPSPPGGTPAGAFPLASALAWGVTVFLLLGLAFWIRRRR